MTPVVSVGKYRPAFTISSLLRDVRERFITPDGAVLERVVRTVVCRTRGPDCGEAEEWKEDCVPLMMMFEKEVVSERPTHDAEFSAPLQQQVVVERACSPQIPTESVVGLLTSNTVQSFKALPDHLHTEAVFLSLMKSHHIFLETEKVRV